MSCLVVLSCQKLSTAVSSYQTGVKLNPTFLSPAAAEKDNSDNDADDDEDGGPHPDPNHCLDGQHLGVRQGYDGGGEDEETLTAGVNIKDSQLNC